MNRHVSWFVLVSLCALACGTRTKVGTGPYADKVAEDVPRIEKAVGVKFKTPPKLEIRSREQVRDFLLQDLRTPEAKLQIAHEETIYKLLGMLPDTLHLADFYVRLLSEQIMGYYDPKTKVLYVVDGAPEEYVGLTILHELVHALQDQYVNIDSLEHLKGDDDRAAAAGAVIEGQATYESTYIAIGGSGNIAAQLPGGWATMRESIREAQATQPIFTSAPMVIQETLLFPYINGADFVRRFKLRHKNVLPLDSLPISTAQVMHDSASFTPTRDVPSTIVLPPIPGTIDENDFGEFGTRLVIYQHTKDREQAIRASNGWDGDRYALVKTPTGHALVWVTVWDTPGDASEFVSAMDAVMQNRFNIKPRVVGERRIFNSATRDIEVEVRDVNGRPVVLYVDVPAGSSTNLVDFAKVKVTPR